MIDFHTHILPGIDDGSTSAEESVEMIKRLKNQGVDKIVLTPHFYAYKSDVEMFLEVRDEAVRTLCKNKEIRELGVSLYVGSEVLYFDELWRIENIEKMCIKGTEYILIEMPFAEWSDSVLQGIERIVNRRLVPIIAHFDRYITYPKSMQKIRNLVEMGALLQINSDSLKRFSSRYRVMKYIKKNMVSVIGTDCHNMELRAPSMDIAVKELGRVQKGKYLNNMNALGEMIIHNAEKIL